MTCSYLACRHCLRAARSLANPTARAVGSSSAGSTASHQLQPLFRDAGRAAVRPTPRGTSYASVRLIQSSAIRRAEQVPPQEDMAAAAEAESSANSSEVPWFMQEETEVLQDTLQESERDLLLEEGEQEDADLPLSVPASAILGGFDPERAGVPPQLDELYEELMRGGVSGLVAKRLAPATPAPAPEADAEESSRRFGAPAPKPRRSALPAPAKEAPPVQLIPTALISSLGNAAGMPDAWTDWTVVVEVRGSAAGSVRRVALEVGEYLGRTRPPSSLDEEASEVLSGLLAPSRTSSDDSSIGGPGADGPDQSAEAAGTAWRPSKILSREAQSTLVSLHLSSPGEFTPARLAEAFKISHESVRRILRAGKRVERERLAKAGRMELSSGPAATAANWREDKGAEERQNRRAWERLDKRRQERMAKEQGQLQRLREQLHAAEAEAAQRGDRRPQPVVVLDAPAKRSDASEVEDVREEEEVAEAYSHPVRYEGLVVESSNGSGGGGGGKRSSAPSKHSAASHGDGNWCMVDAGWCVVHVMTAEARKAYDIEGIWQEQLDQARGAQPQFLQDE